MKNIAEKLVGLVFLLALVTPLQASVIPVDTGFEITYGINMSPGTSNGGDIEKVFIFEWDDSNFNVDYSYSIAGSGNSFLSHVIPFAPTSSLAVGYVPGITGIGDEKDHIYMLTNDLFAASVIGLKWSEVFPGLPGTDRVRHSGLISMLIGADAGDATTLALLTDFITTEAYVASFDPTDSFTVIEYTIVEPPVGGNIPEPTTLVLMGLGLVGLGFSRKRKAA